MSVINQMLRDLDQRRALADERQALPGGVSSLPLLMPGKTRWPVVVPTAVLGLGLAAGLHYGMLFPRAVPPVLTPAQVADARPATPVAKAVAPAPTPGPIEALPAPVVQPPVVAAEPPVPAARMSEAAPAPAWVAPAAEVANKVPRRAAEPPARKRVHPAAAPKPQAQAAPVEAAVPARNPEAEPRIPVAPGNAPGSESALRKAVEEYQAGHLAEAAALLKGVLRAAPGHVVARQTLATVLLDQGQAAEAEAVLREGLAVQGAPALAALLGRLLVDKGQLAAAAEILARHGGGTGAGGDYRALHGAVLARLGRHAEAVAQYRLAVQAAPQNARWWVGLGLALEAEGDGEQAREAYQRARTGHGLGGDLVQFVEQKLR